MDCEQAVALISARLDHEMQPNDAVLLEAHLRECDACRITAEAFALQHQELRSAFEPRRAAAAAVAEQVAAQLPSSRAPEKKPPQRPGRPGVRVALVLAAVAAGAAVVMLAQWWFAPREHPVAGGGLKPLPPGLHFADQEALTPRPRPQATPIATLANGETVTTKAGEKRRLSMPFGDILYVNEKSSLRLDQFREVTLTVGTVFVEVASSAMPASVVVKTPQVDVHEIAMGTKFEVEAKEAGTGVLVAQGRVEVGQTNANKRPVYAGQWLSPSQVEPTAAPRASHLLDWTRDLMAAAESPLVPASQYDGGALIAVDPYGQEAKLSLRNYHIDVHVEDGFARTTIDQTYFNNNPWRLEGTFYFPLPPDASLSRLAMYVDGNLMEGGMAERDYANAVYEQVLRSQRDPALLEWVDGSTFKMRVFPLEGRQEKRIVLSYTQRLPTLYGRTTYRFPAGHSLQVVDRWSFHAHVKGGGALAWNSASHPDMKGVREGDDLVIDAKDKDCKVDRDVVFDLADGKETTAFQERGRFSRADHDGAAYLMLRFRPELEGPARRQRRDWVFLYESSADRDPLVARAQIDVIRGLLEHVERDDTFAVLTAGTRTRLFSEAPVPATPENVAAAVGFLEQTHLIGALDLGRALSDAGPLLQAGKNPYLVHVGSGMTAMGRKQDDLANLIPDGVRYVGVGVGKRWGRSWMKQIAERSGGYFTQINPDEPIAWRAFDLLSTLNTPRLLGVHVAAEGEDRTRFLADNALVAQGEEICAVARIDADGAGIKTLPRAVVVEGTMDGQAYRHVVPVQDVAGGADYLPRTWAKLEIDRLLAENAAANKERVVELSKAMYVMTPFTSLLVLENEEMYERFKVDRGRKDHWALYPCPQKIPVVYEPDPTQPIDVRNAPKTEKPVVNLVLPTLVTRPTPSFLSGGLAPDAREQLAVRLKGLLSKEERLISRIDLAENGKDNNVHFRTDFGKRKRVYTVTKSVSEAGFNRLGELGNEPAQRAALSRWSEGNETTLGARMAGLNGMVSNGEIGLPALQTGLGFGFGRVDGTVLNRPGGETFFAGRSGASMVPAGGTILMAGLKQHLPDVYATNGREYYDLRLDKGKKSFDESPPPPAEEELVSSVYSRVLNGSTPALLYRAPDYTQDANLFRDLISYAPGLNTTEADMQAVLEAEAAPNLSDAPGHVDPNARRLIDLARRPHWRTLTLPGDKDRPAVLFHFDGAGSYVYDHALPLGLREMVVCDGKTLWHLYPEIGLAGRRVVSRFHRADADALTPWTLPPADDLARGADVEFLDDHTVALVPLGARTRKTDDDKPAPYWFIQLVFAADGNLKERRLVESPAGKVLRREVYDDKETVRLLDADGKERDKVAHTLTDSAAPDLSVDVKNLVVLSMPYRSRAVAFAAVGLDGNRGLFEEANGCYSYLEGQAAVDLLTSELAGGNPDEARAIFQNCFAGHGDLRPGLFTILSACGVLVYPEPTFKQYVADHKDDPLARYLTLLGNRAYDYLHNRLRLDLGGKVGPADGFLGRLAEFHDLETQWTTRPSLWSGPWVRKGDEKRTFDFIRRNRGNVFGAALLLHVQNHAAYGLERPYLALAEAWGALADADEGAYAGRYEQARCLLHAGKRAEARRVFKELHARTLKEGRLPLIDQSFRSALEGEDASEWGGLMHDTAAAFIAAKNRPAAVALAWQCRQVGDQPLSDNLLAFALDEAPSDADWLETNLCALEYLWLTDQLAEADGVLQKLLAADKADQDAGLWRLASELAARRGMTERSIACLEKALDLEYHDLPPVIGLQGWRADYGKLLDHYQALALTLTGVDRRPPADLAARTIRAADRWRAHDPEADNASRTAARILQALGERETAWEYATTPSAKGYTSASPWLDMAQSFSREGDLELADRAFLVAADAAPADPEILWRQAHNLRQAGKGEEAKRLLRRIVEEKWPDGQEPVRARARWQLEHF